MESYLTERDSVFIGMGSGSRDWNGRSEGGRGRLGASIDQVKG